MYAIYQQTNNTYLMQNIAANAVVFNVDKLTVKVRSSAMDFEATRGIFAKGYLEAHFNTVDVGFGFTFTTQTNNETGRKLLKVETASVIVDIDREDLVIYVGGSAISDVAHVIEPILKADVADTICNETTYLLN